MRRNTNRKPSFWTRNAFRPWMFFCLVAVILIASTVVGTQPVRAQAGCTASQCFNIQFNVSDQVCGPHHGVLTVSCPDVPEPGDFFLECVDGYIYIGECSNLSPS